MGMKRLISAFLFCLAPFLLPAETLTISVWAPAGSDSLIRQRAFFDELSRRTGLEFNLVNLPLARATYQLKNGQIDGEFLRTRSVYSDTDDVIRSAEPLGFVPFYVFTRDGGIDPENPETFRNKRIVLVEGSVVLDEWVKRIGIAESVTVPDFNSAFQMLLSGRADFTVNNRGALQLMRETPKFESFAMLTPPVLQDGLYLFLHKRHQAKMPAIDAALKGMTDEGVTAKLIWVY